MGCFVAGMSSGDLCTEQSNRVWAVTRLQKWYREHKLRDKIKRSMTDFRWHRVTKAGKCNFVVEVVKRPVDLLSEINRWQALNCKIQTRILQEIAAMKIQTRFRLRKATAAEKYLQENLMNKKISLLLHESNLVDDSSIVLQILAEKIERFNRDKKAGMVFLVAKDRGQHVQALALHNFRQQHLHLLTTNPANLAVVGNQSSVRGAGTAIVEEIIFQQLMAGQDGKITLKALKSAVPFYTKIFFVQCSLCPDDCCEMQLQKVTLFIKEKSGCAVPHHVDMSENF